MLVLFQCLTKLIDLSIVQPHHQVCFVHHVACLPKLLSLHHHHPLFPLLSPQHPVLSKLLWHQILEHHKPHIQPVTLISVIHGQECVNVRLAGTDTPAQDLVPSTSGAKAVITCATVRMMPNAHQSTAPASAQLVSGEQTAVSCVHQEHLVKTVLTNVPVRMELLVPRRMAVATVHPSTPLASMSSSAWSIHLVHGIPIGWEGQQCDRPCNEKFFGKDCSQQCKCLNNAACNPQNGMY
ncbi:unnamed protein product, partial [Timema podura]|nr:unnamed protein product [Timema podura]